MPCPLCRKSFTVPEGGICALPKNFFIEKLLTVRRQADQASAPCEKLKDKTLDVYCRNCKTAICVVCYIASHKQHDCSDIGDVIGEMRQQMTTDISSLANGVKKLREMQTSVKQQRHELTKNVAETEEAIIRTEELMLKIQREKQTLLDELAKKKCGTMKQLDNVHHEIVQQMSLLENLKKYTEELSLKGSPGDIARETGALENRAKELLKLDSIGRSRDRLHRVEVKFTQTTTNDNVIVGQVNIEVTANGWY